MNTAPPPQTFADTACKLWALAATGLGWPPDTFWNATPAELIGAFPAANDGQANGITRADIARLIKGTEDG